MGFSEQWVAYTKTLTHKRDEFAAQRDERSAEERATPLDGLKNQAALPTIGVPAHAGDGKGVVPTLYHVDPDGTVWAEEYPGGPRDNDGSTVDDADDETLKKGDDDTSTQKDDDNTSTLQSDPPSNKEKLTLQALKEWVEQQWARDLNKRGAAALLTSRVLVVPVFEEVTLESLALTFDLSWPQITRCNGITGRQILTDSILVPLSSTTYGVALVDRQTDRIAQQQDEKTLEEQKLCRFMRESGCADAMAAHFYMTEAKTFEEAVALFKEDKEWGERNAPRGIPVGQLADPDQWGGGKAGHQCNCTVQ